MIRYFPQPPAHIQTMTLDNRVIISLNPVCLWSMECNLSQSSPNCFCLVMSPNTPVGYPVRTPISTPVIYEAVLKPREPQFEF